MVSLPGDFPTAERRALIRGAFLGVGRWSNMDQMTKNFAKFYLRKTLSRPSYLSYLSKDFTARINDSISNNGFHPSTKSFFKIIQDRIMLFP